MGTRNRSMAILIDGRLALAEDLCQPFWPSNGVEDEVCPFLLRQLFEADQVLCIQPFNAAQQAWPASHWQQHTRRKRQHKFCPSDALEPQQEQLIKCQRWVCEQDDAAVPEEQRCVQLELSAANATEDSGLNTDGQLYAPQSCSNDIAPTPSYSSSVDHTGAGTGCSSTPRHADTAAPCASRGSVSTTSSCSPEAVQNAGPCAAVLALPAHATQPCQEQQQQHDREQVPVQAAASACSAESAAIDVDDVSAQKAAAQARFAQQQRMQAASSKTAPSTRFDQDLLQQEQDRLLQPGYQTRMFACALLSNLLCCLVLMAAKGPVGRMVGGSPICVQWPLLLALCAAVGWLYMSKLKPLQFSDAALEQHFAMRSQHGRGLLDVWFSLAGISGLWAAARSDASSAPASRAIAAVEQPLSLLSALQLALLLCLMAVLLASAALVLVAPKTYRKWREQLLFVGKVAMVSGLMAMQSSSSFPGVHLDQQQSWLSSLRESPQSMQATNVLLAVGTVQAFVLLALMVRVSAYLPMQLIHVTALLTTVLNSGSSGLGMVLYAVQLLVCGLWAPTTTLVHLELSARRSFLARHLSQGCCGAGKLAGL